MKIGMIGTGYVGLVTGCCLAELGQQVICMDVDGAKVERLKQGLVPFYEPNLMELLKRNLGDRLDFTDSLAEVVAFAEVLMVTVGTPAKRSGEPDTQEVFRVCTDIAQMMKGELIVIIKSTVPVGTCQTISSRMNQILDARRIGRPNEEASACATDVEVVSNPEFLRQGSAVYDFMNPDRIVVGAVNQEGRSAEVMKRVYSSFERAGTPYLETDSATAEMIKYASNAFLASKISYVNELANICDRYEVNVCTVVRAMGLDPRIGAEYLRPGPGFGGSCFPKDTLALLYMGQQKGCEPLMLKAAMEVNKRQLEQLMRKLQRLLGELKGKTISILGVSFKPETDDLRESPAVRLIDQLALEKTFVRVYDPKAMERYQSLLKDKGEMGTVSCCSSLLEACNGAECIVVMTEWNEFVTMELAKVAEVVKERRLLDAHNSFDPETVRNAGFLYEGIGLR